MVDLRRRRILVAPTPRDSGKGAASGYHPVLITPRAAGLCFAFPAWAGPAVSVAGTSSALPTPALGFSKQRAVMYCEHAVFRTAAWPSRWRLVATPNATGPVPRTVR
jgi:hypothetical protein